MGHINWRVHETTVVPRDHDRKEIMIASHQETTVRSDSNRDRPRWLLLKNTISRERRLRTRQIDLESLCDGRLAQWTEVKTNGTRCTAHRVAAGHQRRVDTTVVAHLTDQRIVVMLDRLLQVLCTKCITSNYNNIKFK
jgi:hypothetical protein